MFVPYVINDAGNYVECKLGTFPATLTSGTSFTTGDFTFTLKSGWMLNWFYRDGYFYYRRVLSPGESTPFLLDRVSYTGTAADKADYNENNVKVEVLADILQAEGGAPAAKWGITVNGTTVTP